MKHIVTPTRFELVTPSLKVRCSSQLSYEVIVIMIGFEPISALPYREYFNSTLGGAANQWPHDLEQVERIELSSPAWKAGVISHYTTPAYFLPICQRTLL
jgi:hypothetical protein